MCDQVGTRAATIKTHTINDMLLNQDVIQSIAPPFTQPA
jgi:hypothetical protein